MKIDSAGMSLILCGAIKICDLGHAYSSTSVHVLWSERLEEELYKQVCADTTNHVFACNLQLSF
jgi:hypothetical protein